MPGSAKTPNSASRQGASAKLNIWASETLHKVTSAEEQDKKSGYEHQIKEDGNLYIAWSIAWAIPLVFGVAVAVDMESSFQWIFWFIAVLACLGVFFNLTQALWAKRRRAALDSKISLELLTALEIQRKQNEEVLRRLKVLDERTRRSPQPEDKEPS